ncbi:MAG: D-alanyl-D-alanine carboxypeptidase/D-alanyl-D-alanine-endopeptidase [Bacteroidales bacterium]|nr:D-alanyl-D-alanine carboxypeptidase/D-alanyl-D-alanine-endopeptidase [Bacteroidales bacterium]
MKNKMKPAKAFATLLVLVAATTGVFAQRGIGKYIDNMKKDTMFSNAVVGIMVMDEKGKEIASWNPDMPLLTASTMKTISTGLALKVLGPDYKYKTRVGYTGLIENGTLKGDLYIIGGGDPTLGSKDTIAYPIDSIFGIWMDAVRLSGITRIEGNIVGDDRFFKNEIVPGGWAVSNLGPYYGSGTAGLSFMENLQEFTFKSGDNIGDPAKFVAVWPQVPGLRIDNTITTGAPGSRAQTSLRLTEIERVVRYSGSIPFGDKDVVLTGSCKFPAVACAEEFRKFLERGGIRSNPLAYDIHSYQATAPQEEITIIGETLSPPLSSIVNVTNRISNNFYAETLFKTLGKELTGSGSYDSSAVAIRRVLSSMGLPYRGFTQDDGSGLSRQNYVSARFFCNYFSKLKEKNDNFEAFYNSLPQPGGPGTLENVIKDATPEQKRRLHAKSGSLSNVRCYAGFVERKNGGMYYFAILTNNFQAKTAQMQPKIEGFMKELLK